MSGSVVLALVALVLSIVELIRTKAQSLLVWAVFLLALALVWPVLAVR